MYLRPKEKEWKTQGEKDWTRESIQQYKETYDKNRKKLSIKERKTHKHSKQYCRPTASLIRLILHVGTKIFVKLCDWDTLKWALPSRRGSRCAEVKTYEPSAVKKKKQTKDKKRLRCREAAVNTGFILLYARKRISSLIFLAPNEIKMS